MRIHVKLTCNSAPNMKADYSKLHYLLCQLAGHVKLTDFGLCKESIDETSVTHT